MRAPLDAAQGLLVKASNDLFAADTVIATGEALDTVCFHAQQAVEKSLKALLAMHDVDYPLTHNVQWLLSLVGEFHPHLNEFTEPLEAFELYAVPVRYDEMLAPGLAEARELLAIAHEVYLAAKREIDLAGG